MSTVEESVEIAAPVEHVYQEWTDFTKLPQILTFVERVDVIDDRRSHWVINVAGKQHEYDAEIVNHVPNSLIAWRSVEGDQLDGSVAFESYESGGTKLTIKIMWQPDGAVESIGSAMNIDSMAVSSDLDNFRERLEERHRPTPA